MSEEIKYCQSVVCGKPVPQTPGKKEKRFCNATCRSNQNQKDRRAGNKSQVIYKEPTPESFDAEKKFPVNDESPFTNFGIIMPMDVITSTNGEKKKSTEPVFKKPVKKEMPPGLSKTEKIRWHRENS